ncbi:MAG: Na+/H+ antiporter NhaC family protein [Clostridia bacterium]|nr:Na+/H+ antiporter NhaC family protein [Clostridia bacterium]
MEHYGWISLLPPVVAIVLAIVTREVLLSLTIGIMVGSFIIYDGNLMASFTGTFDFVFESAGDPEWNMRTIMYTLLLGSVLGMLTKAGGARAFADWSARKIKSRKGAQGVAFGTGLVLFFDDYFNALTVGSVMRPVTDKFRISREKLAYITDSTAAPVVILMPISTWVAYIVGMMGDQFNQLGIEGNPFMEFIYTIPYNFYAWLTIIMVAVIIFTNLEYGPMAKAEKRTLTKGILYEEGSVAPPGDDLRRVDPSNKGKVADMFVPIFLLVFSCVVFMIYTGGFFDGGISLVEAIQNTDSVTAMVYGTFLTVVLSAIWFKARSVIGILESVEAIITGMKAMLPGILILVLAWSIGAVSKELGTGIFLAEIVTEALPGWTLPMVIFFTACFMAFATGTSWGTFAVMIPIAIPLAVFSDTSIAICMAALLSGAVWGDHSSPLSDTTILSSTGAGCPVVDHVNTQIPYSATGALAALVGFIVAGITQSVIIPLIVSVAVLIGLIFIFHKFNKDEIDKLDQHIEKVDAKM